VLRSFLNLFWYGFFFFFLSDDLSEKSPYPLSPFSPSFYDFSPDLPRFFWAFLECLFDSPHRKGVEKPLSRPPGGRFFSPFNVSPPPDNAFFDAFSFFSRATLSPIPLRPYRQHKSPAVFLDLFPTRFFFCTCTPSSRKGELLLLFPPPPFPPSLPSPASHPPLVADAMIFLRVHRSTPFFPASSEGRARSVVLLSSPPPSLNSGTFGLLCRLFYSPSPPELTSPPWTTSISE